jgi:hypothetical protein
MSVNLFDYGGFPTKKQRRKISENSPHLNDLKLEIDYNNLNDIFKFFSLHEFKSWIRQFNNRIGEVKLSYIMSIYYYNMGIPDNEWSIPPGKNNNSTRFFPNLEQKHFCIKYFFDYYSDIFYYKTFGVWDSILHLINIFYEINIQEYNKGFKKNIMKELKKHDKELYNYLNELRKDEVYKKANKIRNDLTHNFPPNDVGPGVKRYENGYTAFAAGNYTTSKEFKENMDGIIKLLANTVTKLEIHFKKN